MPGAFSTFPPRALQDYVLLADGERGALVDLRGNCVWMCTPHWESSAVFSTLLGGPNGYAISPTESYVGGGRYEPRSLIWRSRWVTQSGIVECREALAFPGDPHRAVLLRRIIAAEGDAEVVVRLHPGSDFGRCPLRQIQNHHGTWTANTGTLMLRWSGAPQARYDSAGFSAHLRIAQGRHHDLVLELTDRGLPRSPVCPSTAWADTENNWRASVPDLSNQAAAHDAEGSYAVLRGLTASNGGMVAAATTSLPEQAKMGRDYDYRYVWIRDLCIAGQAVAAIGPYELLDDAARYVTERVLEDGGRLAPAYTSRGGHVPAQRKLPLPGYPGAHPPITGNRANSQFQLDVFGETLLLLASVAEHDRLTSEGRAAANLCVTAIGERWCEPESGIWELDRRRWTESRLICIAGLRALSNTKVFRGRTELTTLADLILRDLNASCVHPSGRWQRSPGDARTDGAFLLPIVRGALPVEDPRLIPTLESIRTELSEDRFVYRFRRHENSLGRAEGAFLLCGFTMALAEHRYGRRAEALRWFERNRGVTGTPGLFAEEYDVEQRQLRGNIPQAFVHALLLECAAEFSED